MIEYGQGSTIGFYIEGDENINFDNTDFAVEFYKKNFDEKFKLTKSEMTFISANKYYGEIPYTVTELMIPGIYMRDIRIGSDYRSVFKSEEFTIIETEIR